jgi:RimJ/RimL family protein N-acetyltransferase
VIRGEKVMLRAVACFEKVGFVHEGRFREAAFKHGAYCDILAMGLLRGEFRARWPERWPVGEA